MAVLAGAVLAGGADAPSPGAPVVVPLASVARVRAIPDAVEITLERTGAKLDRTGAAALADAIRAASRRGIDARLRVLGRPGDARDPFRGFALVLRGAVGEGASGGGASGGGASGDGASVDGAANEAARCGFRLVCRRPVLSATALDAATLAALASVRAGLRVAATRASRSDRLALSRVALTGLDAVVATAPCAGTTGSARDAALTIRLVATGTATLRRP